MNRRKSNDYTVHLTLAILILLGLLGTQSPKEFKPHPPSQLRDTLTPPLQDDGLIYRRYNNAHGHKQHPSPVSLQDWSKQPGEGDATRSLPELQDLRRRYQNPSRYLQVRDDTDDRCNSKTKSGLLALQKCYFQAHPPQTSAGENKRDDRSPSNMISTKNLAPSGGYLTKESYDFSKAEQGRFHNPNV